MSESRTHDVRIPDAMARRVVTRRVEDCRQSGFSAAAADRLTSYAWPGDVRELANAIESAVALARFDELGVDDLPVKIRSYTPSHVLVPGTDPAGLVPLDEVERRYIVHVVEACAGNQSLAAQILRIDRKTLHRRIKSYRIGDDPGD